ncbi:unnamed protein product [Spirodela intermedia]|uniref:Uncharacterized protein n=1 Tax=Spirodela intermedia TaxID=51605 RepID=A0A7I8J7B0_SPIIN|nr:unnamed protein product [Spirodela intermedia]CAA6665920.1 unnamed protein product [Spirodela intermedia]
MGHRLVSGGCHPAEQKNGDFALSRGCHSTKRSWMEVGRGASSSSPCSKRRLFIASGTLSGGSFILRSAQQEEALHRIWYALRRWRLVSWRIVLFPTTACSSINRR